MRPPSSTIRGGRVASGWRVSGGGWRPAAPSVRRVRQTGRRMSTDAVVRRRRLAALALLGALLLLVVLLRSCGGGKGNDGNGSAQARGAQQRPAPELPGGGRRIFPDTTVVAFYGAPQADELGELGIGTPASAGRRLLKQAQPYEAGGRRVLPAMELLATIAHRSPGDDGLYRGRQSDAVIRRYLKAARAIGAILILDIQPGQAGMFAEAQYLEKWLREPDVSLALDPEWYTPGAVPGTVIGSMTAREVNAISFWLDELTRANRLPQKLLVVHRFTEEMIVGEDTLKPRENVAVTVNVDGFGGREVKISKYKGFAQSRPGLHNGFKLFYREDLNLLPPRRVLRLRPRPELVIYE